jgi:mannitol/fructose-specific phosphotransferase system IIA component
VLGSGGSGSIRSIVFACDAGMGSSAMGASVLRKKIQAAGHGEVGNGLAIPHGTNEAKGSILRTAISFVRYDEPVDWNGKPAEFVLGIAGAGDDHLALLSRIAEVFTDAEAVERLRAARTPEDVLATLDVVRV